jgi:hypothetical protein
VTLAVDEVRAAYMDVRDDNSPTNWATFVHDDTGSRISLHKTGSGGLSELQQECLPDNRLFAFLRVSTGDSLSKRAKFVFIQWAGSNVPMIKRARLATDRPIVKEVVKEFSVEMAANSQEELSEEKIMATVKKAMGANYDSGLRSEK